MDRREFVWLMGCASAAGILPGCMRSQLRGDPYESAPFGNARILHFTDCHAQLLPIHFREPNVNIGVCFDVADPEAGSNPALEGHAEELRGKIPHDVVR